MLSAWCWCCVRCVLCRRDGGEPSVSVSQGKPQRGAGFDDLPDAAVIPLCHRCDHAHLSPLTALSSLPATSPPLSFYATNRSCSPRLRLSPLVGFFFVHFNRIAGGLICSCLCSCSCSRTSDASWPRSLLACSLLVALLTVRTTSECSRSSPTLWTMASSGVCCVLLGERLCPPCPASHPL
jgi:hypothetical protein